jgi:hypothetical protein
LVLQPVRLRHGHPAIQFPLLGNNSATATPDGKFKISGMVTRSGVSENWKDMVPLYLHQGQGVMRAGFVNATMASTPFEFIMQNRPDKLTVNDFEDVLADVKQ